ncbi:DNA-binding winged helix-turn-helix (wHTH) protein [Serratia fonticola]|uniref:DNA-binding winged helix-turn-helix (WHTH) protein n=1 Tax=Serratia fonticola TaxID=47917 RepID=A0A542D5E8_SERFO|nr:winged helix-turn-helix domain-containing protein [Serratia fonticola]TQI79729.1 DNA-binding winged helix-turn-helix (wHTH) protein [Serratia fonticola]TQI98245.1 DNA-binding winged helix-turn-helix (wHTH) protein [Serratia fonticola]TVZ67773.1 DNA-binding winged helix-turn-helix (wHTH) protein [Serratia fonticola]
MKYRFNDRIIFDADTGMLSLSDLFDEPVAISNPSKRLLQLLITHQGEAVNREVIFKKVWDDYGMISSNNNLNQCVSKLRRVIKALGIDDEVIVTVPKVGFMLRNEILVEPCQAEEKGADSDEPSASVANSVLANRSLLKMLPVRPLRYGWGMLGFIFVVAAGIALYAFSPTSRQESYLGKVGSCSVFMLSSATPADVDFTSDVLAYAERKKVQCSADEYLLLIRSNQVKSYISGISRLFFLRCKILREHKVEMCDGLESESSPLLD